MHGLRCDAPGFSPPISRCGAALLGALLVASQAGCESCSFNHGGIELEVAVQLVDEAGQPLTAAEFEKRRAAATVTTCVHGRDVEQCDTDPTYYATPHPEPAIATFYVGVGGEAYEPSAVSRRCYFPSLRVKVEIPGCDTGEHEVPGARTDGYGPMLVETLKLTCGAA
ncbi:hypothetical protein [Nannocystis bainbridge]|uniref:Uncharacterized protein n=1 Tax=Nannocystis bainbridge TaxID=2995303 RepID=A0ABT5DTR4_9BACT|nr:hypothetical protein [Nannocystis bainbridge]MDC0716533.1 hypothetical protein [Nannocystis bainbridge]